jgi:hypothetical protein
MWDDGGEEPPDRPMWIQAKGDQLVGDGRREVVLEMSYREQIFRFRAMSYHFPYFRVVLDGDKGRFEGWSGTEGRDWESLPEILAEDYLKAVEDLLA